MLSGWLLPPRLPIWPSKAAPPPYVAPIYNWTGFYIGGNGGWGQSNSCLNFVDGFGLDFVTAARSRSGGVIGGQIGYRWQASQWVFGVEAQGDWADLSHTRVSPFFDQFAGLGLISTRTKTDGIGLFTGQIGYAWNAALFYVKGGAAVTSNRFSILETFSGIELASASATRWGGTVGVGFEYGFAPNWSFGVEYNHLFMGDANNSFTGLVDPLLPPLLSTTGSPKTWIWSPCASTIASAVTAHRSQRDTDLALFRLLQQTRSAEMPAFLLEVTCLKNPSGPRPAHNRAAGKPLPIA